MDDELIMSDDMVENLDTSILPYFPSSEIKHLQDSCEASMKEKPKMLFGNKTQLHCVLEDLSSHNPYIEQTEAKKEMIEVDKIRKRRKELYDNFNVLSFDNTLRKGTKNMPCRLYEEDEDYDGFEFDTRERSVSISDGSSGPLSRWSTGLGSHSSSKTRSRHMSRMNTRAGTNFFFGETVEELIEEFEDELKRMWFLRDKYLKPLPPNGMLNLIEDEFIKIGIVTYNMKGTIPPLTDDLQRVIFPADCHHIYAVGTQEVETTLLKSMFGTSNQERWVDMIIKSISMRYSSFASSTLASQHLVIFVRKELKRYITNVEVFCIKPRAKKMMKHPSLITKLGGGATVVSFKFGRTSIVFINCLLTKGVSNKRRRNKECQRILKKICKKKKGDVFEIYDHIFFFGDLNYRLTLDRDKINLRAVIAKCIEVGMPEVIANQDQLTEERRLKRVILSKFEEGEIKFNPTFKFEKDSNVYVKKKFQCYPDRILYYTKPNINSRLLEYNALMNFPFSSHRPVYARFLAEVDAAKLEPEYEPEGYKEPKKIRQQRNKKKYFTYF